ncbi:phage integrase SAM-like domain-containing protein [Chryseobacterium indologenes]|uniref:tyrosine-type recombinase/integrase n=1 Tax=Chryseobacterium indologenes TaxID=253 RepID=UPI002576712B|nr:phage integrase SAM-like domain-containing protein [Chryseobacterium indologenes]MDM1557483.1 phage integrase SAM-like domain-containing protein [Chryseobacterium indologenes]
MATVKYYLRSKSKEANIQMQLSVSRDLKMRTSTGLVINYREWSDRTSLPKQNTPHTKNITTQLNDLRTFVLDEYNTDFAKGILFNTSWLKGKINSFFERTDVNIDDNFISNYLKTFNELRKLDSRTKDSTDYQFIVLAKKIASFQKDQKKNYTFPEIDKRVMLEFKNWLIEKDKLMDSTALRTLKNFKTVLLDARDNGKIIHHQINTFSIESKPALKVFLDFKEIEQIKNTVIVGKDIKFAKDWLIIGCYTGQRVSDLLRMNKKMIYTKTDADGESYKFIELTQEKTGKDVTIPLHDEVEEILAKYNGDFPPTFSDTSFASNVSIFNYNLKKVCELAGIKSIVKGKIFNDDLGRNEIKETEKYNLVSSQICRRSFATNFYGDKRFTTPQIMAITGHATETMFLSYIGKTSADHALNTAKAFKEISLQKKRTS